jgi:hypothetical protein
MLRNLAFVVGYAVFRCFALPPQSGQLTSALERKPKLA